MILPQKAIEEFRELYKNQYGKELNDAEASEAAHNLVNFFDLLYKIALREAKLKGRLKKEPNGFPVDGNYSCIVCQNPVNSENGWYDRWGPKCLLCQRAISEGVIPPFVCKDRDSWYSTWHLRSKFGFKAPTVKKLVREGALKAREILSEKGAAHEYVFLKKENPELADPDRYSSARKSYNRHRDKETKAMIRREREKMRAEIEHRKKKSPRPSRSV